MKILFGLGNPGKKYLFTRHNLGFMLIDFIASEEASWRKKHQCLIQEINVGERRVLLCKPQTFMNLSGKAVREVINFYKIPLEDLLILQDDKDQPFGQLKFQRARGDGGHRGIQDIHRELGSKDYSRLKMGIALPYLVEEQNPLSQSEATSQQGTKKADQLKATKSRSTAPSIHKKIGTAQFVLSAFGEEEQKNLPSFLNKGKEAVFCFIEKGFSLAATHFNSKI